MAKKKEGMFSGRTRRSMEKPRSSYGYLKVPEDVNVFKAEGDSEIIFDIVPYTVSDPNHIDNKKYDDDAIVGNPWWKRPMKVHKQVGVDRVSLICPTTVGDRCPICEDFARRRRDGQEWEDIKKYLPSDRTLYAVVLLNTRDCDVDYTEGEVHIFEQPDFYFDKSLQAALDKDMSAENFPDLEDGLSISTYFRTGVFGKIEFGEAVKVTFVNREEQYELDFVNEVPDLDSMMIILPYKEIEAVFLGMEGMDDDEIDDGELVEETPKRQRKTTRPTERRTSRRTERKESEPEPEEEPRRTTRKPATKKEKDESPEPEERKRAPRSKKKECPFDHDFGGDFDQYSDCDKCKIWDDCKDEAEKAK